MDYKGTVTYPCVIFSKVAPNNRWVSNLCALKGTHFLKLRVIKSFENFTLSVISKNVTKKALLNLGPIFTAKGFFIIV